ncbi:cell division protein FtsW [Secundilactobacillus paracollinoides]|uniref:Probable peptidoglycan glycosyltransferase FtsW n=1 Tax=Secundilactobacillus paracollinoides TaxID=240427 RepID=A0A1B2J094_9LACO|nr:FtsW/RodA/SpoVE family cell cycle protein [Secundilactobacillus paracollinoides]ANZ61806.1 cell division protein FtsW [Secundilactobacillus paracollinoides]ANZ63443.1 cell division protein FtsW [Secundilactobacillus paracollinoides]ANZ67725.1 cell division protein FtsW [Secundilactobacillus paracollinoides]
MKRLRDLDYFLIVPYLLLCAIGIVMVYSASSNVVIENGTTPGAYLVRQAFWVVIGLLITIFMTAMNTRYLHYKQFYWGGMLILDVMLAGLLVGGKTINGAAGWITLGPINIQPAEFVKFFLIVATASRLGRRSDEEPMLNGHWWTTNAKPLALSLLMIMLVLLQPDMGSAMIISGILVMMYLASGFSYKLMGAIVGGGIAFYLCILLPIMFKIGKATHVTSYKLARIVAFVDPFGHQSGSGSQLVNSYYAISNGGLFGVGLGNSIQKRGYLPEPNTDFIMAIISEELGLIGVLIILCLLAFIVCRAIYIGIHSKNTFNILICYGVATYFAIQAFVNIGGVVGFLPITGVTFPFISYGGSSMMSLTLCLGLLINVSAQEKIARRKGL